MDVPRGSRRARHAQATSTAASSQEAQLQAQAQLELEAATHHRRNHPRRQALQVQVTPDSAIAVAAAGAQQTPDNHRRRHGMEPPPNPFRLHRFYTALLIGQQNSRESSSCLLSLASLLLHFALTPMAVPGIYAQSFQVCTRSASLFV
ncbi:anaphase-promoting complex subunit 10 [Trichoderma arundinaceum]|uniref:Anaphase-promoting complex subunit 10 n=1 Tax=Trichoderma arundinaceum TaxID=490622 RepID=A0A395NSP3_TRIAR|nr:anaphase-promoting complex subunit 10 [Trichoderma arundinaceum]